MGSSTIGQINWVNCFITIDLFFNKKSKVSNITWLTQWIRFEFYTLWLIWEIFLANIHVIKVALSANPKKIMEPQIFSFKTKLKNEFAQFLLAQSITLTPGTVTVGIEKDTFIIHALTQKTADGTPGDMEKKIKSIFGDHA